MPDPKGRWTLRLGVVALAAAAAICVPSGSGNAATPSSWLYGADSSSALFRIDAASGATQLIGPTGVGGMTDIAFTPDGRLYGISFGRLYRVDVGTGRATPIGDGIAMGTVNALASDARGHLYVASLDGSLGVLDSVTGRATRVGSYGRGLGSWGDLAFAPDGTLFATAKLSGRQVLLRVNPATGIATAQVPLAVSDVYGLAFGPGGSLVGAANGDSTPPVLVSIDPATGRSNTIGQMPNARGMWGLASRPSRSSATPAPTGCTKATATRLVEQNRLNHFGLPNPVRQALCGPFTGPGSTAMAVTIGAPTCWGIQHWAVFTFKGGAWRLALDQAAFLMPPLAAVGSGIRETTAVHRAGDGRCFPSGGTRARIWRWNGSRLVAGPWQQQASGEPQRRAFYSPSRNLFCNMAPRGVTCSSGKPEHVVSMGLDGRLIICRGIGCIGNAGETDPQPNPTLLAYGRQITAGRFRCLSLESGVRCTVTQTGKGFLINRDGISRVGQ